MPKLSHVIHFLNVDIWRLQAHKLAPRRSFWITQARILLLALKRFNVDKCELRASALTFYSLLSFVPVVALAFAVAKGFGFEKVLGDQLMEKLQGQQEVAEKIIGFAQSMLENTRGGAIAGVGIVVLFWTVVKVLSNIEKSFNDIWGVKTPRSLGRKFADYLSMMMICPVLLIIASSVTVLVSTRVAAILDRLSFLGPAAQALIWLLGILPYAVLWLAFTLVYVFMPNTKVKIKSALLGGILAGTIYQLVQLAYIKFQIGVASYGAIYGSFAALPLLLVWLQLSWLIVLFGAEISFAHQNVATYEFEQDCLGASHSFQRLAALAVLSTCVKGFLKLESPPSAEAISRQLDLPIRLVRAVLAELSEARLVAEVCPATGQAAGYQPACDLDLLTVAGVLERLDERGVTAVPIVDSPDVQKLRGTMQRFHQINEQSSANLRLRDL
jgi:membrane protein